MAKLITINNYSDKRGDLTVMESPSIPFDIKRVFVIKDKNGSERAKHRHKKTRQALICLSGSCEVSCNNGSLKSTYKLNQPSQCLIVEPEDWHVIHNLEPASIIMVLASSIFDESDYIFEEYK